MITRPNVTVGPAVSRRPKTQTIEHYQLFNFDRYQWCRLAKSKKLKDFLYHLHKFFGVISKNNHVPVIYAYAETIIKKLKAEKFSISRRTFSRRMKEAIQQGFFITTEGKAGHLIYIAKLPEQKNKIHILKNAIEKLATHKKYFQIQFLKKAIQKIKDAISKNKTELWPTDYEHSKTAESKSNDPNSKKYHDKKTSSSQKFWPTDLEFWPTDLEFWPTDSEHSILDTDFYTNLGTGSESESKESPIEHREKTNPTFTQNLEKVFNDSKTKIPNPIINELVKIWSVYRPAQTLDHLKDKISRFNKKTYYPNQIIKMLRDDGLTWHLKDRSRYQPEYFGTHDVASLGLRKPSNYWEVLEEKQKPKVVHPTPEPPPKPSEKLKSKWKTFSNKLEESVSAHMFASWFEKIIPLKIEASETILMVSDEFFVEHMTKKYLDILQYTLGTDNVRLITYDEGRQF